MLLFNSRLIHVSLLAALTLNGSLSFAEEAADSEVMESISSEALRLQLLVEHSEDESIVWIDSAQTSVGRFSSAVQPYQMAILGLSADQQGLHRPALLDALHRDLPVQGWHTLSLLVPAMEKPANEEGDENQSDTESAASEPTNTASQNIKAALAFLREQQAQSVSLVCNQQQLELAVATAIAEKDFVSGLVLWNVDYRELDPEQLAALKASRVSILDLNSSGSARQQQQLRKQFFARADFVEDYKLVDSSALRTDSIAIKRIRHWLESEFRKY